jgi:hypothetical protein
MNRIFDKYHKIELEKRICLITTYFMDEFLEINDYMVLPHDRIFKYNHDYCSFYIRLCPHQMKSGMEYWNES